MLSKFEYPTILQALFVLAAFSVLKILKVLVTALLPSKPGSKTVLEQNWKKDTVYLYQFSRPSFIPSISPFCLKLETWLKLKNIPYENRYTMTSRSKHGLIPFVELNGEHLADSQLIIQTLQRHFGAQDDLQLEDLAYARALDRLADGHTFYVLVKLKMEKASEFITLMLEAVPSFLRPLIASLAAPFMKNRMLSRVVTSLGNFSDVEFRNLLKADLDTFKHALGKKKFLFGDSITFADCTVFGQLATTYYLPVATFPKEQLGRSEYKVLVDYLERIRRAVWADDFTKN